MEQTDVDRHKDSDRKTYRRRQKDIQTETDGDRHTDGDRKTETDRKAELETVKD